MVRHPSSNCILTRNPFKITHYTVVYLRVQRHKDVHEAVDVNASVSILLGVDGLLLVKHSNLTKQRIISVISTPENRVET